MVNHDSHPSHNFNTIILSYGFRYAYYNYNDGKLMNTLRRSCNAKLNNVEIHFKHFNRTYNMMTAYLVIMQCSGHFNLILCFSGPTDPFNF